MNTIPYIDVEEVAQYRPIVHSTVPQLVFLHDVLTSEECDKLVYVSEQSAGYEKGMVLQDGLDMYSDHRTCGVAGLTKEQGVFIDDINERLSKMCNWDKSKSQKLNMLKYEPGGMFKPHFDWWGPENKEYLEKYGNRVGTMIMYLNDVEEGTGGETLFKHLQKIIKPVKGCAVFFNYDSDNDRHNAIRTLHAGHTVKKGVAYKMTKWFVQKDLDEN